MRLPYLVAAGLALLNWTYGYFILPESLPKDRRTAIDFKKANPFSAILALAKIQGIGSLVLVYVFTVFAFYSCQATWVNFIRRSDSAGAPERTEFRCLWWGSSERSPKPVYSASF